MRLAHFPLAILLLLSEAAIPQGSLSTAPINGPKLEARKVGSSLTYVRADIPKSYKLAIRVPKPFSTTRLETNIKCDGFAMTGSYTSKLRNVPDGLIVIDGRVVGKDNGRRDGGILQVTAGAASLQRASVPRAAPSRTVDQIYSQPILVYGGVIDGHFKQGKANRIALGSYDDGSLFMVMALDGDRNGLSAVSLEQFARDVIALTPRKVVWLLNFDGGPSAFISQAGGRTVAPASGVVTSYLCAGRS